MRKAALALWLCVALCSIGVIEGCHSTAAAGGAAGAGAATGLAVYTFLQPFIPKILQAAATEAVSLGLHALEADTAKTAANDTILASNDALTYLQSGTLPTADIINQVISAKFSNINPTILTQLNKVEKVLSGYVPSANTVLTTEQVNYLISFFNGLKSASQTFIDNPANAKVSLKYTLPNPNAAAKKASMFAPWFKAKKDGASLPKVDGVIWIGGAPGSDCGTMIGTGLVIGQPGQILIEDGPKEKITWQIK